MTELFSTQIWNTSDAQGTTASLDRQIKQLEALIDEIKAEMEEVYEQQKVANEEMQGLVNDLNQESYQASKQADQDIKKQQDAVSAATDEAYKMYMAGKIEKRYYSIVHGNFEKEIHAKGYLSNDPGAVVHKKRRFTVQEVPESESSETLLLPVAGDGTFSLVEARPRTGRLHQIRATLCSLGYPLAGDKLYGTDETFFLRFIEDALTEEDRASLRLTGQALHAAELIWNGIHFRAPVPDEWKEKFPELFKIMNLSESLMSRK